MAFRTHPYSEIPGGVPGYGEFLQQVYSHLMRPLNEALKDEVDWPPEMDKAFNDTKAALANAALLA